MQRFAMLPVRRQLAAAAVVTAALVGATAAVAASVDAQDLVVAALLYLLIVVVGAVLGGIVVALVASIAAGPLLIYFFAEPVHTLHVTDGAQLVAIGVFVAAGVIVSLVVGQSEARLLLARQALEAQSRADAAQEADRLRSALLAAVGHDLRTPLAAASAAATSLASSDVVWTPGQRGELLGTTIASLARLERLLDDLLDSSRLDAGVLPVSIEPMRVEDAAALALDELGDDGAVAVTVAPGVPDALADPVLVQRIVANLVGNALRHGGGDVAVRIRTAGARVELAVVDHGPGIPAASREEAFRAFRRLDDSGSGAGLGLSLSRGFAEAMGGTLELRPSEGGGLTCVLELPIAPVAPRNGGVA
ncbi:hypothetical protein GCM10017576_04290 [Microbacterium barkeri]|uniref:histidine kinase n=1 Tax=Microbacterium barkeri TaxID=33917 RepID=A0A9W6H0K2_9MICO|nr:ATP-binding protein [Microbacterium barkeri]MDR6876183.1 two-component system sensor histidine kinase KdpD [Microbacterium barkeri]GLJ60300.1 hypothetical protein GCM10017576_04290 [Microbacterium barkeri]